MRDQGPPRRVIVTGRLDPARVQQVMTLVEAAREADGVHPLSEHVSLHLRHGGEGPDLNLLVLVPAEEPPAGGDDVHDHGEVGAERLAGYGHLDPTDAVAGASAELVVHPAFRGQGHGRALVEAALAAAPGGRLRLWAHGDQAGARALATAMGFRVGRRLEQWRRSLLAPLPRLEIPPGLRLRTFRPGRDDEAWLALNARAFADHPEQGAWTRADLAARMRESWFDPEGFFLLEEVASGGDGDPADGAAGRLVAFHWTKVHGGGADGDGSGHGHDPIGEVYVVGVDPDAQGRGLGRVVTLAGLHRLRALGLAQAMLYVEGDNLAAQATYRRLGFSHWDTDVMFYRTPGEESDQQDLPPRAGA